MVMVKKKNLNVHLTYVINMQIKKWKFEKMNDHTCEW